MLSELLLRIVIVPPQIYHHLRDYISPYFSVRLLAGAYTLVPH